MTPDEAFLLLKNFFTERQAPRVALANLRENLEVSVVIGGMVPCAIFRQGKSIEVERREARNPDFIFKLEPQTVTILAQTPDDIAEIGLAVLKEMLAGDIRLEMPGGLLSVLRGGYIDVISSGGAPVMRMLGQLGLTSPTKIVGFFRKLRGR
jgi:hypothetical protein